MTRLAQIDRLVGLAERWADAGHDDLAHHALQVAEALAGGDEAESVLCPTCGSDKSEDTGSPAAPRLTCLGCGGSWNPREMNRG